MALRNSFCKPGAPGDHPRPEANPYPRPPVPIFDMDEIRERIGNWQANVALAPPFSQADSQQQERDHLQNSLPSSPLNFPIVKRRKSHVAKAMRKGSSSSEKDYITSRYFRGHGLADRMSQAQAAANRDADGVTPPPRVSNPNPELTPHSRSESPDKVDTARRVSPTPAAAEPITVPAPETIHIHQITEVNPRPRFFCLGCLSVFARRFYHPRSLHNLKRLRLHHQPMIDHR